MLKKGTIKFYNSEKGYGFIFTNGHYEDVFFHINDWKNPSAPNTDDDVEFELFRDKTKYKAINIVITKTSSQKKQEERNKNDDRIICPGCGKRIVPRMVFDYGTPYKSVCPYCATLVKKFERNSFCFIATAVYEDYNHPQVVKLRDFRDNHLLTNDLGTKFVNVYYKYSPKFADYVKGKKILAYPIKKVLDAFVYIYTNIKK